MIISSMKPCFCRKPQIFLHATGLVHIQKQVFTYAEHAMTGTLFNAKWAQLKKWAMITFYIICSSPNRSKTEIHLYLKK